MNQTNQRYRPVAKLAAIIGTLIFGAVCGMPATTAAPETAPQFTIVHATTTNAVVISGTYWRLLSMTKKGQTPKEGSNAPDVEFCKTGAWGILHYGGRREAGTYQVSGNRLIMKYDDGSLFGNYSMTMNDNILVLDDGEYVLHLKADGAAHC